MTALPLELTRSAAETATPVRLSVLIPFYGDDPRPLLDSLTAQARPDIEIILFDDGAPDAALSEAVARSVRAQPVPVTLISSPKNQGRSHARNALGRAAAGDWLLFLDADMEITPGFLDRWTQALARTECEALFGGYAPCEPRSDQERVHAALAHASDAVDAETRNHQGAFAVCSSNLAIRASLFAQCPFDEGYTGWGWEDVDWALSAARLGTLGHVDVHAAHGGLQSVQALLSKFDRAGPNFARLLSRHPDYETRPGAQLARKLQATGLSQPARIIGRSLAACDWAPVKTRVLALKLFRAGTAARDLPRGRG